LDANIKEIQLKKEEDKNKKESEIKAYLDAQNKSSRGG